MIVKGVIFDFDGTLAPFTLNFAQIKDEIKRIAKRYGSHESLLKELEVFYTLEMIERIKDALPEGKEEFEKEAHFILKNFEIEAAKRKELFPFTRDVLRGFKNRGLKIGVITRNCKEAIKLVFEDIEDYVDSYVTRDDVKAVKPNSIHIEAILELLKLKPKEVILVGDHRTDIMAGEKLGIETVLVLSGNDSLEALREVRPTYILRDIRDLLFLL